MMWSQLSENAKKENREIADFMFERGGMSLNEREEAGKEPKVIEKIQRVIAMSELGKATEDEAYRSLMWLLAENKAVQVQDSENRIRTLIPVKGRQDDRACRVRMIG